MEELEGILERARSAPLGEEEYGKLKAVLETLDFVTRELEGKRASVDRLRKLLFGSKSEKTRDVLEGSEDAEVKAPEATDGAQGGGAEETGPEKKRKGHGRNGADAYHGAEKVQVPHGSLEPGNSCPECKKGKVYAVSEPGVIVRVVGQAPLKATVYELEKLRCNLCGRVFTARAPEGVGERKYDETSRSMIALLKYGSGLPFNRLERLEGNLGIPLPAATQWDLVHASAEEIEPAYEELVRQAAQGEVLHNDDTTMKILELMGKRRERREARGEESSDRKGIFTSGIVSTGAGQRIALFFTGRRHAGENLAEVLKRRASELSAPIQMCDALAQSVSGDFESVVGNCLAHGRRRFVEVLESFPQECRFVLETLRSVYKNDAVARSEKMSAEERLRFHQKESGPLMDGLEKWFLEQFEERKVEPNSGLGEAITYMQNHWEKLTLFLRHPGAPLDNNLCERALKKAILHRKNAYFYRSERGARVGDLFMSLIHTAELSGAHPFDYLTELQRHQRELAKNPSDWMPWNYRESVAANGPSMA